MAEIETIQDWIKLKWAMFNLRQARKHLHAVATLNDPQPADLEKAKHILGLCQLQFDQMAEGVLKDGGKEELPPVRIR